MNNKYAILADKSVESYSSPDSSSYNKRRLVLKPVKDAKHKVNRKQDRVIDKHEVRVMRDGLDDCTRRIVDSLDSHTPDGMPIDKKVVKKYLKQVEESEGFDITDYPGPIDGVTNLAPFSIMDYRDQDPEYYDLIMDLSAFAIKSYNKEHPQTKFKVAEINKLNVGSFFSLHYITFSAVDVKGSFRDSFLMQLVTIAQIIMMTLLIWLLFLCPPNNRPRKTLEEKVMKLKCAPYRASEQELRDETAARKTFQAVVWDHILVTERTVKSCRVAK